MKRNKLGRFTHTKTMQFKMWCEKTWQRINRFMLLVGWGVTLGVITGFVIFVHNWLNDNVQPVEAYNDNAESVVVSEPQPVRIQVVYNWDQQETKEKVVEYFADIPIMVDVARCESTFVHYLDDGVSVLKGKIDPDDTGVMQINKRYHLKTAKKMGLDVYDFWDNLKYARHLYETKGLQPWSASRTCWSA